MIMAFVKLATVLIKAIMQGRINDNKNEIYELSRNVKKLFRAT